MDIDIFNNTNTTIFPNIPLAFVRYGNRNGTSHGQINNGELAIFSILGFAMIIILSCLLYLKFSECINARRYLKKHSNRVGQEPPISSGNLPIIIQKYKNTPNSINSGIIQSETRMNEYQTI